MPTNITTKTNGFTLVEVLVASAIFAVLALGIYQAFLGVSSLTLSAKAKAGAISLANEQIEIARNLPYSSVGILGGWPAGSLPYERLATTSGMVFKITTTVRNLDDSFDGTISGEPNDLTPADYKLVEVTVSCGSRVCRYFQPLTLIAMISPKNLENSSGNGALFVKVFDANGQAVPDANVKVTNIKATTTMVVQDTTNNEEIFQLVDTPPGEFAYRVEVSKAGYSSARTYALGEAGLTNPTSPDATVLAGQLTSLSLIIDRLSNLALEAVDNYCQPAGPFTLQLQGERLLSADPEILRYDESQTISASGDLWLPNLDWDTYQLIADDSVWAIAGSFPLQSVLVPPGADSTVKLVLKPKSGKGLLVAVKDGASGLPLSNVEVNLSGNGVDQTLVTNRGYFTQTDWSAGGLETDGNIETHAPIGELKLVEVLGNYQPAGYLVSGVFDSGATTTTFYNLNWRPVDQASSTGETSIRFQLATGNDPATTTWAWLGPDGTSASYYSTSGATISSVNSPARYLRYRVFLSTADPLVTPNLSDISVTYSSACLPFGQIYFDGLTTGDYLVSANKTGYQESSAPVAVNQDWQILEITLNPQ
ncbi:MAG: prepilin-type N-terminal cleavage/methylation domain-containing protein [Candidatus Paceibacterota bacterium]|jgi:prepilin-type N-terminal cleavage/methylation domain-containing protein